MSAAWLGPSHPRPANSSVQDSRVWAGLPRCKPGLAAVLALAWCPACSSLQGHARGHYVPIRLAERWHAVCRPCHSPTAIY